jgi:hypothetical protein
MRSLNNGTKTSKNEKKAAVNFNLLLPLNIKIIFTLQLEWLLQ